MKEHNLETSKIRLPVMDAEEQAPEPQWHGVQWTRNQQNRKKHVMIAKEQERRLPKKNGARSVVETKSLSRRKSSNMRWKKALQI